MVDTDIIRRLEILTQCDFVPRSEVLAEACKNVAEMATKVARIAGSLPGYNKDDLVSIFRKLQSAKCILAEVINPKLLSAAVKPLGA